MNALVDRLLDALERAGTSAGEQFLAIIVAGGAVSVSGLPWEAALGTSAGAFLVSLLLTASTLVVPSLPYWADLGVRTVKTFAASLVGALGAGVVNVIDVHWVTDLNIAAVAALLCLAKGLLSPNAHLSPSLLPTPVIARLMHVQISAGALEFRPRP